MKNNKKIKRTKKKLNDIPQLYNNELIETKALVLRIANLSYN